MGVRFMGECAGGSLRSNAMLSVDVLPEVSGSLNWFLYQDEVDMNEDATLQARYCCSLFNFHGFLASALACPFIY